HTFLNGSCVIALAYLLLIVQVRVSSLFDREISHYWFVFSPKFCCFLSDDVRIMRSTWAKLKNVNFKGTKLPWVVERVNEYIEYIRETQPDLARKLDKTPYAKLQ